MGPIDVFLRIVPSQLTENLVDQVETLGLPETVATVLATPLIRAADLLTDDNPGNDAAVCGQLTAFIARVNMQEQRGQLSPSEAADLRASADALQATLACG